MTPELPTGLPEPANTRKRSRSSEKKPERSRSPKHRKSRSPEKIEEGGSKFGKCLNCTESGHVTKNCPKTTTDLRETLRNREHANAKRTRRRSRSPRRRSR